MFSCSSSDPSDVKGIVWNRLKYDLTADQEMVIERLIEGNDAVAVMPTGMQSIFCTQNSRPLNTAPPDPAFSPPILPPFPPNTAAHLQVPNKGFVGYIWLPIPPFSEYCRFFASPKIGGIGGLGLTVPWLVHTQWERRSSNCHCSYL